LKSILHIITGLDDGGAEAVLYRLITNDRRSKHTVISLMGPGKYGPLLEKEGFTVYYLNMGKGKVTFSGLIYLLKFLLANSFDILQTWMYHADLIGGIIGRLAGFNKVYWCIHNSTLVRGQTHWKTLVVAKICAALSFVIPRKIISCAEGAIEANVQQGYSVSKFCLIPNGYDLSMFKPEPHKGEIFREKCGIKKNTFLIGIVARFDPQKDILNLIKALGIVSKGDLDFKLVMVGSGMESTNMELNGWIRSYEIEDRVIMLGQQSYIPEIMNAIDIITLSSKYGEAFPNVLCEAMACGTPCVATKLGDIPVIISEFGWVVPPESPEELADAIIQASIQRKSKLLWSAKKDNARLHIERNFSIQTMVDSYHKVWSDREN
jgi:glycosyltransferase involved in cell wall biosynthesis